jgi:hypothetical protein
MAEKFLRTLERGNVRPPTIAKKKLIFIENLTKEITRLEKLKNMVQLQYSKQFYKDFIVKHEKIIQIFEKL